MFSFILWWQVYDIVWVCYLGVGKRGVWREHVSTSKRTLITGCDDEKVRYFSIEVGAVSCVGHRPQVSCRILGSTEDTLWTFVDFLAGRELEYFYKRPRVKEEQISKKGRNHKKYSFPCNHSFQIEVPRLLSPKASWLLPIQVEDYYQCCPFIHAVHAMKDKLFAAIWQDKWQVELFIVAL